MARAPAPATRLAAARARRCCLWGLRRAVSKRLLQPAQLLRGGQGDKGGDDGDEGGSSGAAASR